MHFGRWLVMNSMLPIDATNGPVTYRRHRRRGLHHHPHPDIQYFMNVIVRQPSVMQNNVVVDRLTCPATMGVFVTRGRTLFATTPILQDRSSLRKMIGWFFWLRIWSFLETVNRVFNVRLQYVLGLMRWIATLYHFSSPSIDLFKYFVLYL